MHGHGVAQTVPEGVGSGPRHDRPRGRGRLRRLDEGRLRPEGRQARRRHRRRLGWRHRGQVRAPGRSVDRGHRAGAAEAVHLVPHEQPRSQRRAHAPEPHHVLRRAARPRGQAHPRGSRGLRPRRPPRPRGGGLSGVRPAHPLAGHRLPVGSDRGVAAGQGHRPQRVEGRPPDGGLGPADPVHGRRGSVRPDRSPRRVSLPARALRAHLPGGLVSEEQETQIQGRRPRREPEHRLQGGPVPRGLAGLSQHRLPAVQQGHQARRRGRAR